MAEAVPKVIHVRGVLGAGPHDGSGDLGLLVGLDDGTQAVLRIEQTILSGLELLLREHLAKAVETEEGGATVGRPMALTSCQPYATNDGRVGMVLQIEHMRLPVAFPVDGVPTLVEGLNRMAKLAKDAPRPKTH